MAVAKIEKVVTKVEMKGEMMNRSITGWVTQHQYLILGGILDEIFSEAFNKMLDRLTGA